MDKCFFCKEEIPLSYNAIMIYYDMVNEFDVGAKKNKERKKSDCVALKLMCMRCAEKREEI
jgi:hypothetical protein